MIDYRVLPGGWENEAAYASQPRNAGTGGGIVKYMCIYTGQNHERTTMPGDSITV